MTPSAINHDLAIPQGSRPHRRRRGLKGKKREKRRLGNEHVKCRAVSKSHGPQSGATRCHPSQSPPYVRLVWPSVTGLRGLQLKEHHCTEVFAECGEAVRQELKCRQCADVIGYRSCCATKTWLRGLTLRVVREALILRAVYMVHGLCRASSEGGTGEMRRTFTVRKIPKRDVESQGRR